MDKIKDNINREIFNLESSLGFLATDIVLLQNGDGDNSYWNGSDAYRNINNISREFGADSDLLNEIESVNL